MVINKRFSINDIYAKTVYIKNMHQLGGLGEALVFTAFLLTKNAHFVSFIDLN